MTKYYDPATRGFYAEDVHMDEIPEGSVAISDDHWKELLAANASGKVIDHDEHGNPHARDLNDSEFAVGRRRVRDGLIGETDWLVSRHQDELEAEVATTLSAAKYKELQAWRVALRRITDHPEFPRVQFPARPEGI